MTWKPDYASATELAAYVRVTDDLDRPQMQTAVTSASRAVDNCTGRQFGRLAAPEARYYTPWWDRTIGRWVVPIDDLQTATGLVVMLDNGQGVYDREVTTADTLLRPVNALADGEAFTEIHIRATSPAQPCGADAEVEVVAPWGWTSVPDPVHQATLMQASRFLTRRDSPYGVAGSPRAGLGGESRLVEELDPDIEATIAYYRRVWVFA